MSEHASRLPARPQGTPSHGSRSSGAHSGSHSGGQPGEGKKPQAANGMSAAGAQAAFPAPSHEHVPSRPTVPTGAPGTGTPIGVPDSDTEAPQPSTSPSVSAEAAPPADARPRASSGGWMASLQKRLLSAAVLIPIAVALVWFGGWVAFAGVAAAMVLCMLELKTMCASRHWYPLIWVSIALNIDLLVAALLPEVRLALLGLGISALVIGTFSWLMLTRPTIERTVVDWALTLALVLYVGWPMALFLLLRGTTYGYSARGFWWVLALFIMVWANDAAAFFTGHFFGRRKLAPHISPAKTWEGFAGGLVFTMIAAWLLTRPIAVPWYAALGLGILVCIAATLGDLAESLLKRGVGVKDSGSVIPGHGGILDRVDSLLFGVQVVFFFAAFLQGLPLLR